jgi:DNA-binding NtrC family response regulator
MSRRRRIRVVLVAELTDVWATIVRSLERDGIECDVLGPRTAPDDVVACVARADGVVVVDLAGDPATGMAAVLLCRRALPTVPVVVAAESPSLELTRSIRLSGVFYLALHPADAREMSTAIVSAFEALESRRASSITCRATRRILIVDDDPDFRESTATLLKAYGYEVSTAPNCPAGLAALRSNPPDLLVVDVMMDDGAGYDVNQAVKYGGEFESLRHIPIVMVSSSPVDPATRFTSAAEVDLIAPNVYLPKPLDISRFLKEVRQFLGEGLSEPVAVVR